MTLSSLLRTPRNLIFPPVCESCGAPSSKDSPHLCPSCIASLPQIEAPYCERCGHPYSGAIDNPTQCPNCQHRSLSFSHARAALHSSENTRDLVHQLKYQGRIHLARDLGALIGQTIQREQETHFEKRALLVPVPLHPLKRAIRGFNQAAELCRYASPLCQLPVKHALRRKKLTPSQVTLTRNQRLNNLSDAFAPSFFPHSVENHCIYLIDDVFTTGSTTDACAKVLLDQCQAQKVIVVTAIRG